MQKITPFIWFDDQAEDAMRLYVSVFRNSKIVGEVRVNGRFHSGTVDLDGLRLHCFNGGPHFVLNEAISLMVDCNTQDEVDHLWAALTSNGGQESRCGWLKDRFGVSWQIIPKRLVELLRDPDPGRARRATAAMMTMRKINIAELEQAAGP